MFITLLSLRKCLRIIFMWWPYPHMSHIVQALNSTPFAQFKKNWQKLLSEWNFDNHGGFLGKGQFFEVMWPAWKHAMSVANIQSGFHKTGIYPVNFDDISKSKFTPSQVTESKTCSVFLTVCVTVCLKCSHFISTKK